MLRAPATPTSRWPSSGWPASSASTSRPRTCGCPTGRRSPARPRPRARSRSIRRSRPVRRGQPAGQPDGAGSGTEFVNSIVGGRSPQYIPAVQRGIEETMAGRWRHGFPVVDVASSATTASTTRSTPPTWPSARPPPTAEGGPAEGRAGGARADLAGDRHRARGLPGGRARRPQRPPRPGHRHVAPRATEPLRDRRPSPAAEIQRYAVEPPLGCRGPWHLLPPTHHHYDRCRRTSIDKVKRSPPAGAH